MRARSLKPGLFKNEVLGSADPLLTILFAGLWCMADREGRLEDRPLRICAEVFPYRRHVSVKKVDSMMRWLHEHNFIVRYVIVGLNRGEATSGAQGQYVQIVNFRRHQNPHKNERPSEIPALSSIEHSANTVKAPDENGAITVSAPYNDAPNTERLGLTPDSGLLTPDSSLREKMRARARVSRSSTGVIDCGSNLTRSEEEIAQTLDAWRSVTGINASAFAEWCELAASRGKRLDGMARIALAKWLAGTGDHAHQAAIVEQSKRNGWRNLRPLEIQQVSAPSPRRKTFSERLAALGDDP